MGETKTKMMIIWNTQQQIFLTNRNGQRYKGTSSRQNRETHVIIMFTTAHLSQVSRREGVLKGAFHANDFDK